MVVQYAVLPLWISGAITFTIAARLTSTYGQKYAWIWWLPALVAPFIVGSLGGWWMEKRR